MIAPGDRIEMQRYGADGVVKEVALTTVKVKNWDNTIATIPTSSLVSDSFRNWRGMDYSGCRMINRSILINMRTVKFCDIEMLESLSDLNLIEDYVKNLISEFKFKEDDGKKVRPSNKRRVTNLGIFRRYIINYLAHYEKISNNPEYGSIVGETEPNEKGVGISILAYYNGIDPLGYNNAVANIFDHLFAIINEFELDFYQLPSDTTNSPDKNLSYVNQD
jgi:miniconductance mechanosensitive channel